jgi:hypothetical protein
MDARLSFRPISTSFQYTNSGLKSSYSLRYLRGGNEKEVGVVSAHTLNGGQQRTGKAEREEANGSERKRMGERDGQSHTGCGELKTTLFNSYRKLIMQGSV